jgi:predicted TIM-barrel fold metal-dependent hydrolase
MVLDCHIHIMDGDSLKKINSTILMEQMKEGGVDGGVIMSLPPDSGKYYNTSRHWKERLESLIELTDSEKTLYSFFWMDPLASDAEKQIDEAVKLGIDGFKIIYDTCYPGSERSIEICRKISSVNKPIIFHSGILWDGKVSSQYNRPVDFESMLEANGLRFALAHISWPWVDEHIAVYGKLHKSNSYNIHSSVEMFTDLTPGTPKIYREDALTKIFTVGYEVENNVMFGTDCLAENYDSKQAAGWIKLDNEIYQKLGISNEVKQKIYQDNLLNFLGYI